MELMVTLVIAGILASIAAPSFRNVIQNNRMTTQYNDLLASLSLARSEAIKQGEDVIALSNNGTSWENGWTVFIDDDGDGVVDNAEIIRVNANLSGNNTLTFPSDRITYASSGLATGSNNGDLFSLCDDRNESYAKGLVINTTGRLGHAADTNGNNIVDNGLIPLVEVVCP